MASAAQYEYDGPNDGQLRCRGISYVISDSIPPGQNVVNCTNKQKQAMFVHFVINGDGPRQVVGDGSNQYTAAPYRLLTWGGS